MRHVVLWVSLGLSGCFDPGPLEVPDGDAPTEGPAIPFCGGALPRVCVLPAPTMTVTIAANYVLNTDGNADATLPCAADNAEYCVVAAENITISATLSAYGRRPLVLLASGAIHVRSAGVIDVSSRSAMDPMPSFTGAGADSTICNPAADVMGTTGGPGGSFGGKGGDGRPKVRGGVTAPAGEPLAVLPDGLFGGCPGAKGGYVRVNEGMARRDGAGGRGGGAVAFIAETIQVSGTINASGAAGAPGLENHVNDVGPDGNGGGGGGSGGMISLYATASEGLDISPNAKLFANGGGGGAGAGNDGNGRSGTESRAPTIRGEGGLSGADDGGAGGAGSSGATLCGFSSVDELSEDGPGGGGGGGGGAGFIYARGISTTADISPPPQDGSSTMSTSSCSALVGRSALGG